MEENFDIPMEAPVELEEVTPKRHSYSLEAESPRRKGGNPWRERGRRSRTGSRHGTPCT